MGGATEASIWSNYYEVESVKDGWTSIPYGKPLTNQKFYVLDQEMNDCPNWVAGRLFIAGEGLARGYWKDRKRTEERFINHPVTHWLFYFLEESIYPLMCHSQLQGRIKFWKSPEQNI